MDAPPPRTQGVIYIYFGAHSLLNVDLKTASDVTTEARFAVPATILYLAVGLVQLNMACVLELRSLLVDATISLLGALVALGTLVTALMNLIMWADDQAVRACPARQ